MQKLLAALVKARSEFMGVKKTTVNPFYKSKYADLETCIEATKEALNNNGLVVVQTFSIENGKQGLKTRLMHESGEFLEGTQLIECKDNFDPQKVGSASTYARRYGYMAILGIAPEDDDDGNKATEPKKTIIEREKITKETENENKAVKSDKIAIFGSVTYFENKGNSRYVLIDDASKEFNVYIKGKAKSFEQGCHVGLIGIENKNGYTWATDIVEEIPF